MLAKIGKVLFKIITKQYSLSPNYNVIAVVS